MRRKKEIGCLGITAISLWLMTGCGPAEFLHPLFEEPERIRIPGLAGTWIAVDSKHPEEETLSFAEKENRAYLFRIGGDEESYMGYAGQIASDRFLEIHPEIHIRGGGRFKVPARTAGADGPASPVAIADGLCLVFTRIPAGLPATEELEFRVLTTRMILKLQMEGDRLAIWYLDSKALQEILESGEATLAHSLEPDFLVTASTRELRSFLEVNDQEALPRIYVSLGTFRRAAAAGPAGS